MNVTTLNTTTLDGNVIIKKGGGTTTPPSGGEVLEGEYYLARPNGWYWKYVGEDTIEAGTEMYSAWGGLAFLYSVMDGLYSYIDSQREMPLPFVWAIPEGIGSKQSNGESIDMRGLTAYAEKSITYSLLGEQYIGESYYRILLNLAEMEMSEEEFAAMMLEGYGLQRITKEEYEALITE